MRQMNATFCLYLESRGIFNYAVGETRREEDGRRLGGVTVTAATGLSSSFLLSGTRSRAVIPPTLDGGSLVGSSHGLRARSADVDQSLLFAVSNQHERCHGGLTVLQPERERVGLGETRPLFFFFFFGCFLWYRSKLFSV